MSNAGWQAGNSCHGLQPRASSVQIISCDGIDNNITTLLTCFMDIL
jgi:hypothetical protein